MLRIRDEAQVAVTPADVAAAVEEARGYLEVDAAHAWRSWQLRRQGGA